MLTDRRGGCFILLGLFENDRVSKEEKMEIKCFSARFHLPCPFSCNDKFSLTLIKSILKLHVFYSSANSAFVDEF